MLPRLAEDFKNKCYICEFKDPPSINVEHFVPHQGNSDLKFSWDNLFWACSHCNNTKLAKFGNLLNCTNKDDHVELRIKQKCNPFPHETVVLEALDQDPRTIETRNLLNDVYNGTTKLKTMEAANIRNALVHELHEFQQLLIFFAGIKPFKNHDFLLEQIKGHLSQDSAFTAIKRWTVRDNPTLFRQLGHLLPEDN
ncbi:MAG: HNH endonuclease [Planctomycetales bacterium]|nr:HNH endonuclease [Planctomycetales bacterium]